MSAAADGPLVPRPGKVIAVRLNHRGRAAEFGGAPAHPAYYLKPATSLTGDDAVVLRPQGCVAFGAAAQIGLVIGRPARRVTEAEALDHIGWLTPALELTVFDLHAADEGSSLRSNGSDGSTPIGQSFVDIRAADIPGLELTCHVNGELAQRATAAELIFDFAYLVADLSRTLTLEPGDLILTGAPAGVPLVEPGDRIEVTLTGCPPLRTRIDQDPEPLGVPGAQPVFGHRERLAAHGPGGPPLAAETAARFREVRTATVAAQLRQHGVGNHLITGVRPTRADLRLVGVARTLRCLPLREDIWRLDATGLDHRARTVEQLAPGEVLVIDARQDPGAGTLEDILALRAHHRGAAGIVTDGPVVDPDSFAGLPLPVYHRGGHPAELETRHLPWESQVAVACGGVLVRPGDVLVGDAEGLVVVPAELAAEVAREAVEREAREEFVREQVGDGAGLAGLYPMNTVWAGRFRAASGSGVAPEGRG
ncbi:fumarylacetoacetate hydrolase family protein [Crossiella sp. SN42]|uniref:fumarylacetoacetate hydrolase family protein n=1 Tax=Crossiella sp. SN42 TaxID=2944808 RepID=UPI00207D58EE|nr:fumarylacetoacetate hydrolase family protein [Crossiella sp. SN42]MCO1574636.1 fumarylacetoacetate hydrolase family protein [Crossiella sp. SN42]